MAKQKSYRPTVFGRRMRNTGGRVFGFDVWVLTIGPFILIISDAPLVLRWEVHCFGESLADGRATSVKAAARRIESFLRRIGRALPSEALLSRADWKAQNG